MDILDILLLPKKLYQKITDRKTGLYIGFILVGIIDLSIFFVEDFSRLFVGKPPIILFYNITLAVLLVVLLGFMDVLFFSVPLFDLFKLFKREKGSHSSSTLTRVMKTYVVVNFLILPVNVLFYTIIRNMNFAGINLENSYAALFFVIAADLIVSVWLSAAATRGVNAIYNFDPRLKNAIFMTIFTWSYILSSVFSFIIDKWAMHLFK